LETPEGQQAPTAPDFDCPQCGGPLEFDELPERFFAFMQSAK
jgi:transcription initiation factor IIE alpha subunit